MRVRTAKTLAQRIDLHYFKHARGLRRWRYVLSAAAPLVVLLWVSAFAASGSRTPYSPGPVSRAHAFVENRCEVCHTGGNDPRAPQPRTPWTFRAHATDAACLTCHDGPPHTVNQTTAPACAACHQEHQGRVQMARTEDRFCVECHADLRIAQGAPKVATHVGTFAADHPEFAAVRPGAQDPARVRFNHAVHLKADLRGPRGPETLACAACHTPERAGERRGMKGPGTTGLMAPVTYAQNCARCHPLFFDERLEQAAPHARPEEVRAFVQQALAGYIRANPGDISKPDSAFRRVPLNFPRTPEPPARTAGEWVARRAEADERLLWNKTCVECHDVETPSAAGRLPVYAATNITRQWMPRASFDHTPHLMVTCASCHAAAGSTATSDVLLPSQAACASCHAPAARSLWPGAGQVENRCFECHRYHDWTRSRPVVPSYSLSDLK